ncbi:MAG: hypothetical protein Q7O66_14880 [Dehalococcoidia bacterium]|nr:hypothetical protein [Dehalococcoidia bacterium]
MTRIDELQKKFPTVPREVIIKWAVVPSGILDSGELDDVSQWSRPTSYQNYDFDSTLQELEQKRGGRVKEGQVLRAGKIFMKNGVSVSIRRSKRSPYSIKDPGNGRLALYEGDERIDENIYFPMFKEREGAIPVTSRGTPIDSLINNPRQCFFAMPVRFCEYFTSGEQCKFCNFNATQDDAGSIGLKRPPTINLDDTIEAYRIRSQEMKIIEGRLEMGGFQNSENEGKIYFDFVEKIANAADYKPNLMVHTEEMDRKSMQRLKDVGLDCMAIQMEAWEPHLFNEICPGKAKHAPHERWLESYLDAVDVFGAGNVAGKIIAGLSQVPESGFKTWQEGLASHIEGNSWMIKNGVFPITSNLRFPPGSIYGEFPALRDKMPPSEYYLEMALAHHADMKKYGLYEKLNKFMYCGLCCGGGIYCGELGILEIAGDFGNWMSDVVTPEANWMAQFVESLKGTEGALVPQKFFTI